MVVDMYIIGPKKDRFKLVFSGLFDFSKMKRPTNSLFQSWSCLVLVQFSCSLLPVLGLDFQTLHMICYSASKSQGRVLTSTGLNNHDINSLMLSPPPLLLTHGIAMPSLTTQTNNIITTSGVNNSMLASPLEAMKTMTTYLRPLPLFHLSS